MTMMVLRIIYIKGLVMAEKQRLIGTVWKMIRETLLMKRNIR